VIDPAGGRDGIADIYLRDGLIVPMPPDVPAGTIRLDARGLVVTPGLTDLHVHLREPGNESAETVESGCRAAARGGFTRVVAMPNTDPPADTPASIRRILDASGHCRLARVLPAAAMTVGRAGREPAPLAELAAAGAVAFTDDGTTVADDALMERILRIAAGTGRPVLDHAQDPALAAGGVVRDGAAARRWGLPGIPAEAEARAVRRDLRLAAQTGCRIHIQHVSCAETADMIRAAAAAGIPVSAEATPHHLALCEADLNPDNANFKMNPPLGTARDREALLLAVAAGVIQALATDHAPHRREDKDRGFLLAPFGVVGLETAVPVTYTRLVRTGRMGLAEWVRRWTTGPAAVLGLDPPSLAPGSAADIAVFDLDTPWVIRSDGFLSKSGNTPFEGESVVGQAVWTFCAGRMTWNARPAD
jgi:dihydroorotase